VIQGKGLNASVLTYPESQTRAQVSFTDGSRVRPATLVTGRKVGRVNHARYFDDTRERPSDVVRIDIDKGRPLPADSSWPWQGGSGARSP